MCHLEYSCCCSQSSERTSKDTNSQMNSHCFPLAVSVWHKVTAMIVRTALPHLQTGLSLSAGDYSVLALQLLQPQSRAGTAPGLLGIAVTPSSAVPVPQEGQESSWVCISHGDSQPTPLQGAPDKSCMGDLISLALLRVRHPTPAQCVPAQGLWDHPQTQASFLQSFIQEKKKKRQAKKTPQDKN